MKILEAFVFLSCIKYSLADSSTESDFISDNNTENELETIHSEILAMKKEIKDLNDLQKESFDRNKINELENEIRKVQEKINDLENQKYLLINLKEDLFQDLKDLKFKINKREERKEHLVKSIKEKTTVLNQKQKLVWKNTIDKLKRIKN